MDDDARAFALQVRSVLRNAVIAFHLEAVPVGPDRAAHFVFAQQIADLVSLNRVVEGADAVSHLFRHIHHQRHLICAVAMVVDEDIAIEHTDQSFFGEVTFGLILFGIGYCVEPGLAIDGEVAHPG